MKRTILVAGLGLIGGSLAKAIKKVETHYLIGYDLSDETLQIALEENVIDEKANNFEKAAKRAEIIVLAAPISETIKLLERLDSVEFDDEVIVTDVSSVKGSILEAANQLENEKITFIGGHPMAGSHKTGIKAAREHLFENAIYVLTPTTACSSEKVNILKDVLRESMSNVFVLHPDEHAKIA